MEEYRIDIKVRNNLIIKKIELAGYKTIGELCRKNNMMKYVTRIGEVINMKHSPLDSNGNFYKWLEKFSDILKCSPEDLFTDIQLNTVIKSNKKSIQVNEAEMRFMLERNMENKLLEEMIVDDQKNKTIDKVLETLTPREKKVLDMRFGMGEYDREHTLKEIGEMFGVCNDRIRQIQERALRKLRHFKNADLLREYI